MGGKQLIKQAGLLLMLLCLIVAAACSTSVSQADAEQIAKSFIEQRVKFFAKEEGKTTDIPQYAFDMAKTQELEDSYLILLHVSAVLGNDTKTGEIVVNVSKEGKVISFAQK